MKVEPMGESFLILRDLPCPAPLLAAHLETLAGIVEAYAAFDTVGVQTDGSLDIFELGFEPEIPGVIPVGRVHEIPVLYDGEDLAEVANLVGISPERLAALHAGTYDCRAVGFCPGFAYLAPLPPALVELPRRPSPRPRVAPGSVAIAAGMTAVYPLERPGGWWLIGRTPLTLVDEADSYFPIQAGDSVRFVPIGPEEFENRQAERLAEPKPQ